MVLVQRCPLSFGRVFDKPRRELAVLGRDMRVTYFPNVEVLIIKIFTKPHEEGHCNWGSMADKAMYSIGIGHDEFLSLRVILRKG